jgi:hypothetical protein
VAKKAEFRFDPPGDIAGTQETDETRLSGKVGTV